MELQQKLRESEALVKQKEQERKDEIAKFQQFSQQKLDEVRKCDSSITEEKQRQWDKERTFLETQLTFVQQQLQEQSQRHDAILLALQAKGQDREREDSRVITANKNLTDSLR